MKPADDDCIARAARTLLNWSQPDLANAASIGRVTVANFERGYSTPYVDTLKAIRAALETAGIDFIPPNGGGPGLRLKSS